MTLSEFRAWLEGYSASFTDGVPNAEQWAQITAKLAGVVAFAPAATVPTPTLWGTSIDVRHPPIVTSQSIAGQDLSGFIDEGTRAGWQVNA